MPYYSGFLRVLHGAGLGRVAFTSMIAAS